MMRTRRAATLWAVATLAALGLGCEPEPETVTTELSLDLRPCVNGRTIGGPGEEPSAGGSTCSDTLDRTVGSGTVNTCLVVQPRDGGAVRRLAIHWEDGAGSYPLGGNLELAPGQRFDAGLFFLAEGGETGRVCDAYTPDSPCQDDARCVLKLSEIDAVMAAEGTTTIDFVGPGGQCATENGPTFAPDDGRAETCDGVDNDCDQRIDEGFDLGAICEVGVGGCRAVGETVCNAAGDGVECGAQAGAIGSEACGDGEGVDDDCDGRVDENLPCFVCADDASCAGHPAGEQCVAGRCVICDPIDPAIPGCGPDALCCPDGDEIVCVEGTLEVCTACQNGGCDPESADGCLGRACACGPGAACADEAPFCVDGGCVECRVDGECEGGEICEGGQCIPGCRDDDGCGADALCCGLVCTPTGFGPGSICTDCNTGCDPLGANGCGGRACLCGGAAACADPTPVCDPAAPGNCVECIADAQCAGFADRPVCDVGQRRCVPCLDNSTCGGETPECVDTTCVECNAADEGPGYRCVEDGQAPICDGGACRACEADAECAERPGDANYCVEGRCAPCAPDGDRGCLDPLAPICDPVEARCRGCGDAAECNENLPGAAAVLQCADDGRCVGCVPTGPGDAVNIGCRPESDRPVCDAGGEICRTCADDAECPAGAPFEDGVADGEPFEALTACVEGRCRQCRPASEGAPQLGCQPDGPTPFCAAGDCAPCEADVQCAAIEGADPVCVDGRCRACDPAEDRGCDDLNFPVCDPETFTCRPCGANGECRVEPGAPPALCVDGVCTGCDPVNNAGCNNETGTPVCADDDGDSLAACRACLDDGECVAVAGGGPDPTRVECVEGRCFECDPVDNAGCDAAGPLPFCGRDDDGAFRCRACARDGECGLIAPEAPQCVAGQCRACDPVGDGADDDVGCGAPTAVCDLASFTCRGCAEDGECPDGQLCRPDGTCAACVPEEPRGCDLGGGAPVCDAGTATCRGCADDAECAGNPNGALCVAGTCQACDPGDHRGCEADALCCAADGAPSCVPTSIESCTACGVACAGSNRCADRTCLCGEDAPCAGVAANCDGEGLEARCIACFTDDDCVVPGYGQCVDGVCTACDPTPGAGAAGCAPDEGRPFCEPEISACLSCESDDARCAEQAGRPECIGDSCFECDPDEPNSPTGQVGCDTAGPTPFCDPAQNACVGCAGEDDRCLEAGRGQCVDESCFACDPRVLQGYAGCDPASPEPFCDPGTSTCRACTVDRECDESPGGGQCVGDFCRVCDPGDFAGCELDSLCCDDGIPGCRETDFAVECEACGVPCDPVTADNCTDRTCLCGDAPACADGTPFCLDSACVECLGDGDCGEGTICVGNACVECDPADDRGCDPASDRPACGDDFVCAGCTENADCAANPTGPICLPDGTCRACDPGDHDGCELSELCCADGGDPSCEPTDPNTQCEACDQACDDLTADTCTDRGCACGDAAPCAGETPFCVNSECFECRDDGDCGEGTICVGNACVECDPADDRGCDPASDRPACGDDFVCAGCSENADCAANPSGPTCLGDGTCRVCDPADQDGCALSELCCADGGDPSCEPTDPGTQCEACDQACDPVTADTCTDRGCACGDAAPCADGTPFCLDSACVECLEDGDCGEGTICVSNACVQCDPADDRGCDPASATPTCGGDSTCGPCGGNDDCAANPGGAVCLGDGRCRTCNPADHDGCGGDELCCADGGDPSCEPTDPATQCEACDQACDPVTADTCTGRGCACGDAAPCADGTPFCVESACVQCRGNGDCGGDTPLCVGGACVECNPGTGEGCDLAGDTPVCGGDSTCRGCADNGECAENPGGPTCTDSGACRVCDLADHAGCPADELCCGAGDAPGCEPTAIDTQCEACATPCVEDSADACTDRGCACGGGPACGGGTPLCDGGACVQCRGDGDCGGDTPECVLGACVACDPGDNNAGCDPASATPICAGDFTCQGCADNGDCAGNGSGEFCVQATGECRACDPGDHDGCGGDALCCAGGDGVLGCEATAFDGQCEACDVACNPEAADTCTDRGCACGADPACGGDAPFCVDGGCTECREDADCAGNEDGEQCVAGACTQCDQAANGDADCDGVTPICDVTNVCLGCAEDAECAGNPAGDFCDPSGACATCVIDDHCPGQVCQNNACVDPEVCDDGADNDGDGATDCADEDCTGDPACVRAPGAGDLFLTEIMPNSDAVIDFIGEWFELYNPTDFSLDLEGVEVRDNNATFTFPAGAVIPPRAYTVFTLNPDPNFNGGVQGGVDYGGIFLGNAGDELSIVVPGDPEVVLDAVDFTAGWPANAGEAVQFDADLDPTVDETSDIANWCAATEVYGAGDRGTPGAANTACP